MAKKLDVYFPLIVGDWLKGTRGMRANVRGVYIGLLLYQWDNGFIPSDLNDLTLIDSEVGSVWVSLKHKFKEIETGKLQNEKVEEVRAFFLKQAKNGQKGGRPPKEEPKPNPNNNPNLNPPFGLELGIGIEEIKGAQKDFSNPDVPGDEVHFPVDTEPVRNAWAKWKEYRHRVHGKTYGLYGEQAALKQLERMNEQQILDTLFKAIESNWLNLYPDKNGNGKQQKRGFDLEGAKDSIADYLAKHG